MRDKPSFDDLEPPPPRQSRIDGLTDAEWAERRRRRKRNARIVWGLVVGALVGAASVWKWDVRRGLPGLATFLVIGGSMVLFASLFAQRRDDEAVDYAGWVTFPEWMLVERTPWWVLAMVAAATLVTFGFLVAALVIAYFPQGR